MLVPRTKRLYHAQAELRRCQAMISTATSQDVAGLCQLGDILRQSTVDHVRGPKLEDLRHFYARAPGQASRASTAIRWLMS